MEFMKAATQDKYGGPEVLEIRQVAKPKPKDNELLIRVDAAPVTAACGFMREGTPYLGRLFIGLFKPKNKIPGTGFSGEVEAIGSHVELFNEGDLVFGETLFGAGTHAQYICVAEDEVLATKPENMTHGEASTACDGHLTSMNFLQNIANLKSGQKILIIGASGSLGSAAVQIAVNMGAHVTGLCSTVNIELVKSLGAHAVIDYTKIDFTKNNQQYDVIYDTVGKSTMASCCSSLTKEGIYMSPVLDFKLLCQALLTSKFSKKKAKFSATGTLPKSKLRKMLYEIKKLMNEGKLSAYIDRKYSIEQISEAHAYVDTGRKRGNVVILLDH